MLKDCVAHVCGESYVGKKLEGILEISNYKVNYVIIIMRIEVANSL